MMIRIREAAVAGSFYPAEPGALRAAVAGLLDSVPETVGPAPRALVVPHAGYVYSGPVAARAYARLRPFQRDFRHVILLGPAHYVAFDGLALSTSDAFRTPLGEVPLDSAAIAGLEHPAVRSCDAAHRPEHSLEVQLPFLQCVLDSFALTPLLVGHASSSAVAEIIDLLWEGPDTLVVVSTDLSHYLDYDAARRRDRDTCLAVESMNSGRIGHTEACGAAPLRGLLIAAHRRGLRAVTLDLRNSGDTAGGRDRVVGYGSWMFVEDETCEQAA
ncbi:MAG: AmmeMemoRadiSam system protein B [Lysobacterales bacterium]|jgi:AmmeMemoRadiSam system protein B